MTRSATHSLAGAAVCAVATWLLTAGSACGGEDDCEFNAVLRDIGGVGLMDCGIASEGDSDAVDGCAVDAYRSNQTFRAIYEQDDGGLRAIVHAAGDSYHLVTLSGEDGSIARAQCESGVFVQENGRSYVDCADPEPFRDVCR